VSKHQIGYPQDTALKPSTYSSPGSQSSSPCCRSRGYCCNRRQCGHVSGSRNCGDADLVFSTVVCAECVFGRLHLSASTESTLFPEKMTPIQNFNIEGPHLLLFKIFVSLAGRQFEGQTCSMGRSYCQPFHQSYVRKHSESLVSIPICTHVKCHSNALLLQIQNFVG